MTYLDNFVVIGATKQAAQLTVIDVEYLLLVFLTSTITNRFIL